MDSLNLSHGKDTPNNSHRKMNLRNIISQVLKSIQVNTFWLRLTILFTDLLPSIGM